MSAFKQLMESFVDEDAMSVKIYPEHGIVLASDKIIIMYQRLGDDEQFDVPICTNPKTLKKFTRVIGFLNPDDVIARTAINLNRLRAIVDAMLVSNVEWAELQVIKNPIDGIEDVYGVTLCSESVTTALMGANLNGSVIPIVWTPHLHLLDETQPNQIATGESPVN